MTATTRTRPWGGPRAAAPPCPTWASGLPGPGVIPPAPAPAPPLLAPPSPIPEVLVSDSGGTDAALLAICRTWRIPVKTLPWLVEYQSRPTTPTPGGSGHRSTPGAGAG